MTTPTGRRLTARLSANGAASTTNGSANKPGPATSTASTRYQSSRTATTTFDPTPCSGTATPRPEPPSPTYVLKIIYWQSGLSLLTRAAVDATMHTDS